MGNESPEITALHIVVSLIDDELEKMQPASKQSRRDKDIYQALIILGNRLEAEISTLESNTTN